METQRAGGTSEAELDIRQGVVRARAFLGLRDYRSARAELQIILAMHPDDVGALRTRAALEEATGRWRQAAQDWARVAALTGDPAATARRMALVRAHPSYAGVTAFFEGSAGVDSMQGVRLSYARRPLDGPEWLATLEHRTAHADTGVLLNGTVAAIDTDRRRLEVELGDTLPAGRWGVRIIATDDTLGAGLSFRRARPSGAIEIAATYHEPYWAYAANLENGATVDHIDLGGDITRGRWAMRGRLTLSEYGVDGQDTVARSTKAVAAVDYALGRPESVSPLRLNFVIERESFSAIGLRQRPGGTPFAPIETADRLVLSAGASKTFGDRARRFATLGVGYRRDTQNDTQGPYGSVLAETPIGDRVRLGLRAEYSDVATRGVTTEPYSFAEVYIRRTF